MIHKLRIESTIDFVWFLFSGALLVMTLVLLETHIHGNESIIPNFNKTMFQFVVIGHWIVVAVMGLIILLWVYKSIRGPPRNKSLRNFETHIISKTLH